MRGNMSQNEAIDNFIHAYFYQGHSFDMLDMLSTLHSISMNMQMLKRKPGY